MSKFQLLRKETRLVMNLYYEILHKPIILIEKEEKEEEFKRFFLPLLFFRWTFLILKGFELDKLLNREKKERLLTEKN